MPESVHWFPSYGALYGMVLYSTIMYSNVQYGTLMYSTVLYSTVVSPHVPERSIGPKVMGRSSSTSADLYSDLNIG